MRKLRYVSDIHCEINLNYEIPDFLIGTEEEDIVLVGDTTVAYCLDPNRNDSNSVKVKYRTKTLLLQLKGFKRVFIIMGNHEHYNGNFQHSKQQIEDYLYNELKLDPKQYIVLDNTAVELDDKTVLLGATLWTDMGRNNESSHYFVGRGMNDFRIISNGPPNQRFTTYDAVVEHKNTLSWMEEQLEKYKDKRIIVATHHCPSYLSKGRYHDNSMIGDGYCSNLNNFILSYPQITDWIHGHTHVNVEYKIGECRVTSNMRGYVDHDWYCKFDAKTFLEKFIAY